MDGTYENQIQQIVNSLMDNLKCLTDVESVVGKPLVTFDGTTILPVSQVSFGFVAGGGEYGQKKGLTANGCLSQFAGGSGGGATITPVAFLVITGDSVQVVSADGKSSEAGKFAELAKDIFMGLNNKNNSKKEIKI